MCCKSKQESHEISVILIENGKRSFCPNTHEAHTTANWFHVIFTILGLHVSGHRTYGIVLCEEKPEKQFDTDHLNNKTMIVSSVSIYLGLFVLSIFPDPKTTKVFFSFQYS